MDDETIDQTARREKGQGGAPADEREAVGGDGEEAAGAGRR